jgi:MoaA/NifB/PqqE/SkfB family radical SAM enzyme
VTRPSGVPSSSSPAAAADSDLPMVGSDKILVHADRVAAFLRGEPIAPVTLELGLTAACNRACPDCPSSLGSACMTLSPALIERLLAHLEGRTRGLIVTGGEPTLSPHFAATLVGARRRGFEDVAVVSNGTTLGQPGVAAALLEHASVVRISLYDWNASSLQGVGPTLDRIAALRGRIDASGSGLRVGTSVLTSAAAVPALPGLISAVARAGAHFVYFHPSCVRNASGGSVPREQLAVREGLERLQRQAPEGLAIHLLDDRYAATEIRFDGYHAAHFILVVAADGCAYLATEAKYQERYMLRDLEHDWRDDFLEDPDRQERIAAVSSSSFAPAGSRNRGALYSALLQRLADGDLALGPVAARAGSYLLPHVI